MEQHTLQSIRREIIMDIEIPVPLILMMICFFMLFILVWKGCDSSCRIENTHAEYHAQHGFKDYCSKCRGDEKDDEVVIKNSKRESR
jgi:hypothetical protein